MGRFPQDGNFDFFCHLKKCLTTVVKPDLLHHLFGLFCGEHYPLITLPQPRLPISSLQWFAIHSKCSKNALVWVIYNRVFWCILNALQCVVVHCSELMWDWGWGSVIRKSWSPQNNKKKWRSKFGLATAIQQFFFKLTRSSQNFLSGETYQHIFFFDLLYCSPVSVIVPTMQCQVEVQG